MCAMVIPESMAAVSEDGVCSYKLVEHLKVFLMVSALTNVHNPIQRDPIHVDW